MENEQNYGHDYDHTPSSESFQDVHAYQLIVLQCFQGRETFYQNFNILYSCYLTSKEIRQRDDAINSSSSYQSCPVTMISNYSLKYTTICQNLLL